MQGSRKPLAKVEGRRSLRQSKLTIAWRGTPDLDDWVAYIVNKTKSKKLILADQVSERKVKVFTCGVSGRTAVRVAICQCKGWLMRGGSIALVALFFPRVAVVVVAC